MEKTQQEELQKRFIQMQMLDAQMKQMHKQLENIEENVAELMQTRSNINSIKDMKVGTDILVPMSSGIFIKGKIVDNSELLVNVGANTVVNKSIDDTKELLDAQMQEITKFREELVNGLRKLEGKAIDLEKELSKFM